jgi:protocatechuate 3,4-dioxygenase beta subunit
VAEIVVQGSVKRIPSLLTRRGFLRTSLGATAALSLQMEARSFALDSSACKLTARQEVGPYYIPGELFRSDITEHKPGVPLVLKIVLLDARNCKPLADAAVDVWHCDAAGVYSGFAQQGSQGPPGPPPDFDPGFDDDPPGPPPMGPPPNHAPNNHQTFLRGIQRTGADGVVSFRTVFPGVYMGRTNHIHYQVRVGGHAAGKTYNGGHTSYVGQIFFPEEVTAGLMQHDAYRRHEIERTAQNEDYVFTQQQGELSIARLQTAPGGLFAELAATVNPAAD